jgi:hypothetical protein
MMDHVENVHLKYQAANARVTFEACTYTAGAYSIQCGDTFFLSSRQTLLVDFNGQPIKSHSEAPQEPQRAPRGTDMKEVRSA